MSSQNKSPLSEVPQRTLKYFPGQDLTHLDKPEIVEFLVAEITRRQEVIEKLSDFQNMVVSIGIPTMSGLPIAAPPDTSQLLQGQLSIIQEAMWRLTEPWEARN